MSTTTLDDVLTPTGPSVGASNHTTVNVIVQAPPPAVASKASPTKAALPATKKSLPKPASTPIFQDIDPFGSLFRGPGVKTEHFYDANGGTIQHTRLIDPNGTIAEFRRDPNDHNNVRLTITDKDGKALVTQGNTRGFAIVKDGQILEQADPWNRLWFSDALQCGRNKMDMPSGHNATESVTRDKLQQTAQDNPLLAGAMRGIKLPVTVVGGLPKTFEEVIEIPSEFRACPANRSGVMLERLTEKSAPRK